MEIEVQRVSKVYYPSSRQKVEALRNVSLSVRNGEFVCLLGPSGCGKSTLLKLIAGMEQPTDGIIKCGGLPVRSPSTDRGFVFQDYALFPWHTVRQNIGFGLKMKRIPPKERNRVVREYLQIFGLEEAARLYPHQLSGGMRQRVALARALCLKPKVLLMDEPFGALDAMLRQRLQNELMRTWEREAITFVLVTHDVEEAVFLADRIVVMSSSPGQIKETVVVDLPRPRVRTSSEFVRLRAQIMNILNEEQQSTEEQFHRKSVQSLKGVSGS